MALFREEAIRSQHSKWLGDIILVRPLSHSIQAAVAGLFGASVCALFLSGTYTRHTTVSGQLVPDTGLVKIFATQPGVVIETHVSEGQAVRRGDVLYVLSSERQSSTFGATQAGISRLVEQRQASLQDELQRTRTLQVEERKGLRQKLSTLESEAAKLDNLIANQNARVDLSQRSVALYDGLQAQHFISKENVQGKQEALLDQKSRLQSIERDRISVGREESAVRAELNGLALKHANQLAQIMRSLAAISQELAESEGKRHLEVIAPVAGVATAVTTGYGQMVDTSRPLLSILPSGAQLKAELYAPSRALGFVSVGQPVLIRYQAYPYQKFGHQHATIESIARTAVQKTELNATGVTGDGNTPEQIYRITATLGSQDVKAYGRPHALQPGMLFEADIQQEKRRLYEWVLEPLYSLSGKL
ncbi:MAG: HlyD family efflux transporter periplasmic adaptor subunit [Herminiimonas sp.]|nr:HlyD family efflux transporter periplasmic adaptor subunit [Herminiimonas sp.]